jgi:protein involved in polysaccharide export with SLBB domain
MLKEKIVLIFIFIIFPLTCLNQTIDRTLLERLSRAKTQGYTQSEKDSLREKQLPSIQKAETLSTIEKMFKEKYLVTYRRIKLELLKDSLLEQVKAESLKIEMRTEYLEDQKLQYKYLIPADTTYFRLSKKLSKVNKQLDSLSVTLRQFGYDMFQTSLYEISAFAPVADNYVLGPGDQLYIEISGELNESWAKNIDRDGSVVLPYVGSIKLWGYSYGESKRIIEEVLRKEFSNIEVSVTLGNLKSVNVFVLGEVNKPGIYNITVLSNPLASLFEAGGPKKSGSLRKIKYISTSGSTQIIDLYRLFIEGKPLPSLQFSSGDILFVPPIGNVVGIRGAVNRPGIYEIEGQERLSQLIKMSGGFIPTAGKKRIQLERISPENEKFVKDLKFENENDFDRISKSFRIENGDLTSVFEIPPYHHNYVEITGNVKNEGIYELKTGMTVLDLIKEAGGAKKGTSLEEAELIRFAGAEGPEIIKINLKKLIKDSLEVNIQLKEYDKLKVLIKEEKESYVHLDGEFIYPGSYRINEGTTLKEVIERAGGFTAHAYVEGAIFTKKSLQESQNKALDDLTRETRLRLLSEQRSIIGDVGSEQDKIAQMAYIQSQQEQLVDLKKIQNLGRVIINLMDTMQLNIPLEDGDEVYVPRLTKTIQVIGEVYNATGITYEEGLSINDYLKIAGGPKPTADIKEIYVQRASGKIEKGSVKIKPGDTIVVPEKVKIEKSFWAILGYTVDIVYKVAIAVVAINTLSQ